MEIKNEKTDKKGFLAGLIVGGLTGAGTMLLFAPQSGKNTRDQIQEKSIELRDQTVQSVENTVDMVKTKTSEFADSVHQQAGDMQQRGQEMITEQKRRWMPAGKAIKDAVQD